MAKLNKEQLIDLVAQSVDLGEGTKSTKKNARAYTDAVLTAVATALSQGNDVALQGFGVFEVRERSARKGRNPQTGESIDIPASQTVGFRATGIKSAVR